MPELIEILNEEEASFARTLNRGEALFSRYAAAAAEEKRTVLSGKDIWRLYDTYGFPVDLTQIMAEERGLKIDEAAFEKARLESLEASKAGGKAAAAGGVKLDVHDLAALEANEAVPKTNDSFKYGTSFSHDLLHHTADRAELDDIKATIKSIYHSSKFYNSTKDVPANEPFGVLLDKTNFYAEQGGQENDTGVLAIDGKAEFKVGDVQVYNGYVLHIGQLEEGELNVGDEVICTYDEVSTSIRPYSKADYDSCDDGLSEITTLEPTFSTLLFERLSVITLTRRDLLSRLPSYDSTFPTTSLSLSLI